jgi:hypothetical protein
MIFLTQTPNSAIAALWVGALKAEGVEASVQRQYLGGAVGELPPCFPEVWIESAEQEARAQQVLFDLQHLPQQRWTCQCGELVEGGFQQCWNCSAPMPNGLHLVDQ